MAVFAYRGRAGGGAVTGEIEAESRPAAVTALRAKGVIATSVQEKAVKAAAAAAPKKFVGKYPRTFDHLFTNMLAVGESGGVLDVVLQRLSGYIEKAAKLKSKVKSAMVYPITIIGVACLVIIFMMIFVLPTFANMFRNMRAELPLPTKIVMWMSDMTRKYVIFMLAGVAAAFYAIKR